MSEREKDLEKTRTTGTPIIHINDQIRNRYQGLCECGKWRLPLSFDIIKAKDIKKLFICSYCGKDNTPVEVER